jgi:hypothetical protein
MLWLKRRGRKKKRDEAAGVVRGVEALRRRTGWGYRRVCAEVGVACRTLMRWRGRIRAQEAPIRIPGPRKFSRLSWETWWQGLGLLRHGRRRTAGTGELYRRCREGISRRELCEAVRKERRKQQRSAAERQRHVRWMVPGAVWAMDDKKQRGVGTMHQVQDLASRYKFPPPIGRQVRGEEVAGNLEALVRMHGAPLVLKRDNGGNLNHEAVEECLDRNLIIPLNSPPYYPRYNGGIERAQRELGEAMSLLPACALEPDVTRERQVRLLVDTINHTRRPCLGGRSSCEVFCRARAAMERYNRRRRKEALREIASMCAEAVTATRRKDRRSVKAAWRRSVETWLLREGIIAVSRGKCVTHFS